MKITENRFLSPYDLRSVCIENDWYTKGDNEEYSALMDKASICKNITTNNLYEIARNICEHSNMRGYWNEKEAIEGIMFSLAQKLVATFAIEE